MPGYAVDLTECGGQKSPHQADVARIHTVILHSGWLGLPRDESDLAGKLRSA